MLGSTLENVENVLVQAGRIVFLMAIEDEHLLVGLRDVYFGFQFKMLTLNALEKGVDVRQGLLLLNLAVSGRRDDPVHVLQVECNGELQVLQFRVLRVGQNVNQQSGVLQIICFGYIFQK